MSRLDAIQQRLNAATPGPWFTWAMHRDENPVVYSMSTDPDTTVARVRKTGEADADLIANAPADLAALLAVARFAQALVNSPMTFNEDTGRLDGVNAERMNALGAALHDLENGVSA